jgi:hypothetical protein
MEQIAMEWLPPEQYRILKQIQIVGNRNGSDVELGRIFYKRRFSSDYNLQKQADADKEKKNALDKHIFGWPKQENYPVDYIDLMIISAVRDQFPNSNTRSDTMFHTFDLEKLQVYKRRLVYPSLICFSPDLSDLQDIYDLPEKAKEGFKAVANIYSYYNTEDLKNQVFFGTYDINGQPVRQSLLKVEFE